MKVLVLGGYGNFGARICRALCADPTIELLVGGRSLARASAFANTLGHSAQGLAIDHTQKDLAQTLRGLGAELVIHTAGPFHHRDASVLKTCIDEGVNYLDVSDSRSFTRRECQVISDS